MDKTKYLYPIIKQPGCFFLSRPRRFGKSMLLDTLRELLKGNRDLFKGLWIDPSDYD
ncbi:MAG: AAA family ATPase, partial [Deltaproteobacteria bacterium]|nr:AAA family ATPase [Deltaproteobacteria bacterium]